MCLQIVVLFHNAGRYHVTSNLSTSCVAYAGFLPRGALEKQRKVHICTYG